MKPSAHIDRSRVYRLSGETLSEILRAAHSWENLTVEVVVGERASGQLIRAEGRSVLRIEVPASSGGGSGLPEGVSFEEFTICEDGSPSTRWLATWTSDPS